MEVRTRLDLGVHVSDVGEPEPARQALQRRDLFVLAWFVASAATVGGGLGSGLESDEAIRAAAYSKREEDRRNLLARQRNPDRGLSERR